MNSRHLTGHAIDIAPLVDGQVSWDWPLYHALAPAVKQAAKDLGVSLEWGGDWRSFKDGPHWQLSWGVYNKDDMTPRAQPIRGLVTAQEVNDDYPRADYAPDPQAPSGGFLAGLAAAVMEFFRR